MNGWMDGRVGRCLDGWTEGWMDGLSTFSYFYSHKDLFDLVLSLLCYQVKFFSVGIHLFLPMFIVSGSGSKRSSWYRSYVGAPKTHCFCNCRDSTVFDDSAGSTTDCDEI